jgi:hypothetical protein
MKRRFRHQNGKAKKWIETCHAKKYIAEQYFRQGYLGSIAAAMAVRVNTLASSSANTPIEEIEKARAVAQAVIDGYIALNNAVIETNRWGLSV